MLKRQSWCRQFGFKFHAPRVLLFLCGFLGLSSVGCERKQTVEEMLESMSVSDRRALETMTNTPFIAPGVESPQFVSAADCGLQDSTNVVGVLINGEARAYPLVRLSSMMDHVINDNAPADGKNHAFSIIYCDMSDCVRVLASTTESNDDSLKIGVLGLLDKEQVLQWNGKDFKATAEVDGLKDLPCQRTTWGEWKAEHPDSLVYKGPKKGR